MVTVPGSIPMTRHMAIFSELKKRLASQCRMSNAQCRSALENLTAGDPTKLVKFSRPAEPGKKDTAASEAEPDGKCMVAGLRRSLARLIHSQSRQPRPRSFRRRARGRCART